MPGLRLDNLPNLLFWSQKGSRVIICRSGFRYIKAHHVMWQIIFTCKEEAHWEKRRRKFGKCWNTLSDTKHITTGLTAHGPSSSKFHQSLFTNFASYHGYLTLGNQKWKTGLRLLNRKFVGEYATLNYNISRHVQGLKVGPFPTLEASFQANF